MYALEQEPQAHLEPAGVVALGGRADLAETGVLDALRGGHREARVREVWVVRGVQRLGAELDALAFPDPRVLDYGEIEIVLPRSAEGREAERPGTELVAEQLFGGRGL